MYPLDRPTLHPPINPTVRQTTRWLSALVLLPVLLVSAAGRAGSQTSRNATLLSSMNIYSQYTGVWGYVHPDGREYAALGTRTGTSIVRLTVPTAPAEVAFIPGPTAGTRDIRQYRTYLYIVANFATGGTPGIQVVNMADPDHPLLVNTYTATLGQAEYVNVDSTRALLFASEADEFTGPGGVRIFSLADPANPVQLGAYGPAYRIHDFHGAGNVGYACAIDNGMVDVLDITNPAAPVRIASFATPQGNPHSSWTTSDGRYLLVTDEDFAFGIHGRPCVFDVQNPAQAKLVYEYRDLPASTSHIPSISGNTAAVSYYTAGVRLWDLSVPTQPVEFGFYDTWGGDDFLLAGNYQASIYLPSGIVLAADDATGLYLAQPERNYGIVRGIVRSASNGMKPLGDVTVRVAPFGPATLTGPDGAFALAPGPGTVTIQTDKYGYAVQSAAVTVAIGSDQQLNFVVSTLSTGSIKGTVRRASDASLFAGVDVTIPGTPFATVTNSKGAYTFSKVAIGSINVSAEYVGFVPISTPLNLGANQRASVDFSLSPAPFYDDADTDRGWTFGAPGDDATQGQWVRAVPIGTMNGSEQAQPATDHTPGAGTFCFVTGNNSSVATVSSVNGGKTTLTSPVLNLSGVTDPRIVFWRWYYHNHSVGGAVALSQPFVTEISNDAGTTWTTVSAVQRSIGAWERIEIRVTDFFASPGNVRVRFTAQNRVGGIAEAALDDFEYYFGTSGALVSLAPSRTEAGASAQPIVSAVRVGNAVAFNLKLDRATNLVARVIDVQGRLVADLYRGQVLAGPQQIHWYGQTVNGRAGAGIYFLQLETSAGLANKKFAWVR